MDRIDVITQIDRLLNQALVLAHHLSEYGEEPVENYVKEILAKFTSLDRDNSCARNVANKVVFQERYGVDLDEAQHWRKPINE
ncbi:MAG: hypothetical protein ACTSPB_26260 [Candidatus Thorarchaeota archaeon]